MHRLKWFGFWTLLGLVSGAQLHLANQRFAVHPPSWWLALATGLSHWYLWGLLALVERRLHAAQLETRLSALHGAVAAGPEESAARRHPERLLVVDDGRSFFVRTADVDWIEAARNYVRLHVGDRTHTVRTTLAALEARLDEARFRRVSRSALVNLDRVREVQPWFHGDAIVILETGAQVTLSRRYRANLLGTAVS